MCLIRPLVLCYSPNGQQRLVLEEDSFSHGEELLLQRVEAMLVQLCRRLRTAARSTRAREVPLLPSYRLATARSERGAIE